jgi:tRNA pseudouridine38-40 synthase
MTDDGRRNVRMTVAYDGTDFHGFARSAGVRTVLGELADTVERIARVPVDLTGAGRTDAGVHGWGQVISGRLPADVDLERIRHGVNRLLGPEVAVRSIEWVSDDFDARFSATSRSYRYEVWNDPAPHPLLARSTWHVHRPLDVEAMDRAAGDLVGEHDFASFCRRPRVGPDRVTPSLVRIVLRAGWHRVDDGSLLRFGIAASSFCHQMVRSVVGTLVEIGEGRRPADSIPAILAARDRSAAGRVAPPTGLVLWDVGYDGTRWDEPRTDE